MKNKTLIFLALAGLGIYYYMKSKKAAYPTAPNPMPNSLAPVNDTGVPKTDTNGVELAQTLDQQGFPIAQTVNARFSINGNKKYLGNIPNTI